MASFFNKFSGTVPLESSIKRALLVAAAVGVTLGSTGCTLTDNMVRRMEEGPGVSTGVSPVTTARVLEVRDAYREEAKPQGNQFVARVVGGALGGLAGNSIGGGRGKTAATIAGAGLGQHVGAKVGESMDEMDVRRIRVKEFLLEDQYGKKGIIYQDSNADLDKCRPGDTVLLTRVRGVDYVNRCVASAEMYQSPVRADAPPRHVTTELPAMSKQSTLPKPVGRKATLSPQ